MPYIITTTTPEHPWEVEGTVTRRAVATLDEARAEAWQVAYMHLHGRERRDPSWMVTARELPESGGTVGPLPDGTVIAVKPVTLATLAGSPAAEYNACHTAEILDAYNAAQS